MEFSNDQVNDTLIFRIEDNKLDTPLAVEVKEKLSEL